VTYAETRNVPTEYRVHRSGALQPDTGPIDRDPQPYIVKVAIGLGCDALADHLSGL
jgi:hypothetical protein